MFDMLTLDQLHQHHDQAWNEHTRLFTRSSSLPVTNPQFPAVLAAMLEVGEHLRAIGAEIQRREAEETTDAVR